MAHLYRLLAIVFICFSSSVYSQGVLVGSIDLAGWIKNANGTYSKAFGDSTVTRNAPTNSTLSATSTALVQTSKGATPFEITKTATIDTSRLGSSVAKFAKRVGPVGMTVTAVSLVCELTEICQDGADWLLGVETNLITDPINCSTVPTTGTVTKHIPPNGYYDFKKAPCGESTPEGWGFVANCNCPFGEKIYQKGPYGSLPPGPHAPTDSDWAGKESLLNDDRFTPDLVNSGEDVPTSGIPTLTPGQKKGLGLESKPTKDSEGNVTGREDTVTEIEAVDAGTTDNPGRVIIKETQTTIKYDINNNQISSTTNTSYSSQPQNNQNEPAQYTISFDEVPEAVLPTYAVPNSFEFESWGAGSCPPNVSVSLINTAFEIPTQPVCDMAEMVNPFVVLIASIVSIYIIAGVRGSAT